MNFLAINIPNCVCILVAFLNIWTKISFVFVLFSISSLSFINFIFLELLHKISIQRNIQINTKKVVLFSSKFYFTKRNEKRNVNNYCKCFFFFKNLCVSILRIMPQHNSYFDDWKCENFIFSFPEISISPQNVYWLRNLNG